MDHLSDNEVRAQIKSLILKLAASNIRAVAQAGADTFVAGSAIFGSRDYGQTIRDMRSQINGDAQVKARR